MAVDPSLPLGEVLRRCHRDELLPLARVLQVNPLGMGRDKLALVLEKALKAAGASKVENYFYRSGKGPHYTTVLQGMARRMEVEVEADISSTEQALLRKWRDKGGMSQVQADQLDRVLGPSSTAIEVRRVSPWSTLELVATVAMGVLRMFAPILGPFAAIWLLLWISRPRDELLLPAILQVQELRGRVARRFTIAVVGPPSSGKDAALAALFGIRTGNVHPVAGSTREVGVYLLLGSDGLQVVNTPGVGDVLENLTEETRAILDQVDLFLFLVNAQGGVRTREKNEYTLCRTRRRPILVVVNKIDTLKAEDRDRFVEDVRSKLNLPAGHVMATAFDPLPQLSPTPIGVENVRDWLRAHMLEMGRDPGILPR